MIRAGILKLLRKVYRNVVHPVFVGNPWPEDSEWETTNAILTNLLIKDVPCLISRIGTVEGAVILNYLTVHSNDSFIKKCLNYITDDTRMPFYDTGKPFYQLQNNAGFFVEGKVDIKAIEKFAELYLRDIAMIDVCGRFAYQEKFFPFSSNCKMVQLESLYPFFSLRPWTKVLSGKRVLVVHPFKDTILAQYSKHRKQLFRNPEVLPEFQLDVIKAVQTIAGEKSKFRDWFEALDFMKEEIVSREFDFLIVGCGAYGLPLAAFAKSLGKKAIHLGGGTQLLFGIKGKRWEGHYHGDDTRFSDLFNEYWVYPSMDEKPKNANKIEGGCYW